MNTATLEKLKNLPSYLAHHIRGQAHVLAPICSLLRCGELGLADPARPRGSMLLLGPTGVGKTELTLCFTDYLFGPGHMHRFDMPEFQNQSSVGLLLGQSSSEIGMLGRALNKSSCGTLLFDEIEKAHPLVLDLLLPILDAGRITLANGETKDLSNYYVVLTSNIGAAEAMRMENSAFATIERTVLKRVDQLMRPEIVGRIDERIVFTRLTYETQREICKLMMNRETDRLQALGYGLTVESPSMEFLVREGHHRTLGARRMRRAIARHLQDAISLDLLEGGDGKGRLCVETSGSSLHLTK